MNALLLFGKTAVFILLFDLTLSDWLSCSKTINNCILGILINDGPTHLIKWQEWLLFYSKSSTIIENQLSRLSYIFSLQT